ncbi:MAG: hypothetical protein KDD19_15085 [Phaeodactylibacter sp.]|nr:hypothetical protein [Phaeodactylibacter sp.]MCB9048621.1 hypothetical protein [Lewinellaceae bacterium]
MMNAKHALVIGNNNYQDSEIVKLTAPVEGSLAHLKVPPSYTLRIFEEGFLQIKERSITLFLASNGLAVAVNRVCSLLSYSSGINT